MSANNTTMLKPHIYRGKLTCPKCGESKMRTDRSCCWNCGVIFIQSPWICKNCGTENCYETARCSTCGADSGFRELCEPLTSSVKQGCAESIAKPQRDYNLPPASVEENLPHSTSKTQETPPGTKIVGVGLILIIFAILHYTGIFWSLLAAIIGEGCDFLSEVASVRERSIGSLLYNEYSLLKAIEMVMGSALFALSILYFIASYRQNAGDYCGVKMEKTTRMLTVFIYLAYLIGLFITASEIQKEEYLTPFEEDALAAIAAYEVVAFMWLFVMLIAWIASIHYFDRWGTDKHFPYNYPKTCKSKNDAPNINA